MTTEEKARAYDEALEVMRQWIAPCHTKEQLDTLKKSVFPELAESEDERIRKAIIKSIKEDSSVYEQEVSKEQMLAYLEKQKEQKPAEWSEEEYGRLFDIEHYLGGTLQLSPDRRIACIDFLKSLRSQSHWKPSEEQMKALLNIEGDLRAFQYNDKAKIIAELYEQLKRL